MNDTFSHSPTESQRKRSMKKIALVLYVILILLILSAGFRVWIRYADARELNKKTPELAKQYVLTVSPLQNNDARHIELPGTLQGFIESPIYARSNGYLLHWYKDIGSNVKKGDILAKIDTPEVDQQLAQATASRNQISASVDLAKSSLTRWEKLRQKQVVSQQEFDERNNTLIQAQANLAAAEADVKRLQNLASYKKVVAPFSGVITKRNVDIGDLINPGTGDVSHALFMLSQTDKLKVYLSIPQSYAANIKEGQQVDIRQTEAPAQVYHGKIERTSGAIDSTTRTLQAEVVLPNNDRKLLPGSYVKVSLSTGTSKTLSIPSNVLLFRPQGPCVAVVDDQGKVHLKVVTIGQDFGSTLEILDGIEASDQLVLNPPDSLADGDDVIATQHVKEDVKK